MWLVRGVNVGMYAGTYGWMDVHVLVRPRRTTRSTGRKESVAKARRSAYILVRYVRHRHLLFRGLLQATLRCFATVPGMHRVTE